jgi:hypothetical protein
MTIGSLFLALAFLLFFCAAVGIQAVPNPQAWGLAALALGLLLGGWPLYPWRVP